MGDALELEEQLVRMLIFPAAELAAVVGEHRVDGHSFGLEGGQDVVVHQLDGGERQLVGVEPGPRVTAVAVDGGLQVDLADALQHPDEEGVDGHERAGVRGFDVAFAELRTEAFEQPDLFVGEGQRALGCRLLQAQQPVVLGQQAVALPDAADAAGRHLQPAQDELLGDPQRAMAGMGKGVVEHRLLDLRWDPVRVRPARAGQPVDKPVGAVGLEVAADLVELLT